MGILVGKDKKVSVGLDSLKAYCKENRIADATRKEAAKKAAEEEAARKKAERAKRATARKGGLMKARPVEDAEPAGNAAGTAAGDLAGTAVEVDGTENIDGDGGDA